MYTSVILLTALLLPAATQAFFFGGPDWNGLKVTFGINPFDSYVFDSMPRKESEAISDGWRLESSSSQYFCGKRYIRYDSNLGANDPAVMLLFDANGYIAGIQSGIADNLANGFPSGNIKPPMIHEADKGWFTITAYFVDTDIICGTGRTEDQFDDQGTGTLLAILNSASNPRQVISIPSTEQGHVQQQTEWTRAKCFYGMGRHYWYNLSEDMDCDDFQPMFLMYNGGELNAFGFAFGASLAGRRFEHPTSAVLDRFLDPVPQCLRNVNDFSTIHIYMTNSPRTNFC